MSRSHDPAADPSEASSTTPPTTAAAASAVAPAAAPAAPAPAPAETERPAAAEEPAPESSAREPKAVAAEEAGAPEAEAAPTALAVAVAEDSGATGTAAAAAGAPPGRPRGSLLAAAGIAGTLLISVPFLVMAMNDDDSPSDRVRTEAVGGATLDPGLSGGPGAAYRAEAASPSSTSSASPSAKPKKDDDKAAGDEASVGRGAPAADAPGTDAENAPKSGKQGTTGKHTTKKTQKKSAAATARSRADAASSQSRVLLKNVSTGQCADVPNYGNGRVDGPVNQYPCNGTSGDNQLWDLVPHSEAGKGPGGSVLFVIRNSKDGFCLDLPNFTGVSGGTRITEYHCRPARNDNQFYWLDRRSDGTYWIRNLASRNLCLNVAGAATGRNDAALQIGTCNDSSQDDTHWYFTRG
ncbi:hypothetical protein QFZ63_000948 [Streptomyces sp. B3I7]|uniref:RICIN domain-containing protein n=1 Tax=Streptomyces sp. B3I7 TaxID=3042269 RepID=UPI00278966E8|nr:RICIN domain-containing protein [Streptomyces sp. B3I7]MDQ0809234.1 hypothetical protein [Streptomyces sp. B3I7]